VTRIVATWQATRTDSKMWSLHIKTEQISQRKLSNQKAFPD